MRSRSPPEFKQDSHVSVIVISGMMNFAFVANPLAGRGQLQRKERPLFSRRQHRCPAALSRPRPARCALTPGPGPADSDEPSFSSMAAGPSTAKPAGGRLGRKRNAPPPAPKIMPKTAADFAAEGIVDDTDETDTLFEAEDIRFGVGNVADPFSDDDARTAAQLAEDTAAADLSAVGAEADVTGDGAVLKRLTRVGAGAVVAPGARVTVAYSGALADGTVFDATGDGGAGFEFVLGAGTVIKGWEAGVATMKLGETAQFTIAPAYAYGRRGMPPVIPGNATLTFTIEVTAVSGGDAPVKSVEEYNPDTARSPQDIAREYDERLQTQAERKAKMSLLDRFYIISPFASQTGEALPWWINPRLTFIGIFALVGVAFYFVFISGAIHQGYVQGTVDVNIFK